MSTLHPTLGPACRRLALRLCTVLAAGPASVGVAADPATLGDVHHTAWTLADGAPVDIWALAQASDGQLWLGTGTGLYRFDGVQFRRHDPAPGGLASTNITALSLFGDDEAWVGYHAGGASRLGPAGVEHFPLEAGFPPGMVYRFERDGDGVTWVATESGLARLRDGRWQRLGDDDGYGHDHADWLLLGSDGTLWVATGSTVVYLPPGAPRFLGTGVAGTRHGVLAQDDAGRMWYSDRRYGTGPLPAPEATAAPGTATAAGARWPFAAKRMRFDRSGALWATDGERGGVLRALPGQPAPQRHERRHGLTSDVAVPVLEDREGNIWVGTNLGLNRYRPRDVHLIEAGKSAALAHFALFRTADGRARLVQDGVVYQIEGHRLRRLADGLPQPLAGVADDSGMTWLLGETGVWRWPSESAQPVAQALPFAGAGRDVLAMAADGRGGLFLSGRAAGIHHFDGFAWRHLQVPVRGPVTVLAADGCDGLWVGAGSNRVALRKDGRWRVFDGDGALRVGAVTAIHCARGQVLIAGERGLARFRDGDVRSLAAAQVGGLVNVTGIAADAASWWFNGSAGLVQMAADELDRAYDDPAHLPGHRVFDQLDGMPGVALQARPAPTLAIDRDGVLLIAGNQGAAWLDPARIRRNPWPPKATIHGLATDAGAALPGDGQRLPEGTTQVRFDYGAASLTVPERVHFRYRLDGVDADWQDAGNRRQAFYSNLGPGPYRFQVMAANNDGVWSTEGAALDFSIAPTFLQSRGFLVACALLVLTVLWLLHQVRVRTASARLRERLEAGHQERERIARELHDTLLQGFQGLLLRFQAIADQLPQRTPVRDQLDAALDRAEQVLGEGRDRVSGLRGESTGEGSLADALREVGKDYASAGPVDFQVQVRGEPRPLRPLVQDELFLVGREALVNAFLHAQARRVAVDIRHGASALELAIQDDGCGLDPRLLAAGSRRGHWGLAGMHERSQRLGGTLAIHSSAGTGTRVSVQLAARRAYSDAGRPRLWQRLLRRGSAS